MDIQNPLIQKATTTPELIIPGKNNKGPVVPLNEHGTEKFARKDNKIYVPPSVMMDMKVQIPMIYYWEDVNEDGTSCLMTMAFKMLGQNWGMSFPIEEQNYVKIEMLRKKLYSYVKSTLDVLVHHGKRALDNFGNIDPRLVNDEEASRYRYDPLWDKKVAAFNSLVRVAPITKKKAIKMGLLDQVKVR